MTDAELGHELRSWADWFDLPETEYPKKAAVPSFVLRLAAQRLSCPVDAEIRRLKAEIIRINVEWRAVVAKWRSDYDAAEVRARNACGLDQALAAQEVKP